MAKVHVFVFALMVAQGYCSIADELGDVPQTRPVFAPAIQTRPLPVAPEVSQPAAPPCVQYVRLLLQAIINKLPTIEVDPLPEFVPDPQIPEGIPELVVVPEPEPEADSQIVELPVGNPVVEACNACFEHIDVLLYTAKKLVTLKH